MEGIEVYLELIEILEVYLEVLRVESIFRTVNQAVCLGCTGSVWSPSCDTQSVKGRNCPEDT